MHLSEASLAMMIIGSIILIAAFSSTTVRMYKERTTTGLNLYSWCQNFVGRSLFVIYGLFASLAPGIAPLIAAIGLTLSVAQALCSLLTVPIIYYTARNLRTSGRYISQHFSQPLLVSKILVIALSIALMLFAILASPLVGVIGLNVWNKSVGVEVLSWICSTLTATAFIPQAYKTFKSKNTSNISLQLSIFFITGNLFIIATFVLLGLADGNFVGTRLGPIVMIAVSTVTMGVNLGVKIFNISIGKDMLRKSKKQTAHTESASMRLKKFAEATSWHHKLMLNNVDQALMHLIEIQREQSALGKPLPYGSKVFAQISAMSDEEIEDFINTNVTYKFRMINLHKWETVFKESIYNFCDVVFTSGMYRNFETLNKSVFEIVDKTLAEVLHDQAKSKAILNDEQALWLLSEKVNFATAFAVVLLSGDLKIIAWPPFIDVRALLQGFVASRHVSR